METLTSCPLCGEKGPFSIHIQCRDYLVSQEIFSVTHCASCDLLFTNPRPSLDEMSDFYQSDEYISHAETVTSLQDKVYVKVKRRMLSQKLGLLKKHLNQQFFGNHSPDTEQKRGVHSIASYRYRILDFGCGTGAFVKGAAEQGIDAIGFEPDFSAREVAAKQGVQVIGTETELGAIAENSFHAITLWHVIEHLHDFKNKLNHFQRLLKPGGVLFLAAPMANSSDAVMYGKYWAAWDLPRHILHFTPSTLKRAGEDSGFDYKDKNPLPFDAWYISLISEQYKKKEKQLEKTGKGQNGQTLLPALKAGAKGSWSNLKAITGASPWSSQTFVFVKPADKLK